MLLDCVVLTGQPVGVEAEPFIRLHAHSLSTKPCPGRCRGREDTDKVAAPMVCPGGGSRQITVQ